MKWVTWSEHQPDVLLYYQSPFTVDIFTTITMFNTWHLVSCLINIKNHEYCSQLSSFVAVKFLVLYIYHYYSALYNQRHHHACTRSWTHVIFCKNLYNYSHSTWIFCKNLYNHSHFTWIFCKIYMITATVFKFFCRNQYFVQNYMTTPLYVIVIILCDNLLFLLYFKYYALLNVYIFIALVAPS